VERLHYRIRYPAVLAYWPDTSTPEWARSELDRQSVGEGLKLFWQAKPKRSWRGRALMLIMPPPHTPIRHASSQGSVKAQAPVSFPSEKVKPDDDVCMLLGEASRYGMQPAVTSGGVVASEVGQNLVFHGPIPHK
jgi:hypothetical protein